MADCNHGPCSEWKVREWQEVNYQKRCCCVTDISVVVVVVVAAVVDIMVLAIIVTNSLEKCNYENKIESFLKSVLPIFLVNFLIYTRIYKLYARYF